MRVKLFFTILFFLVIALNAKGQVKSDKDDNVVVQMNYCINTLTNIIHNKSMAVLEHESDQLVNNLTMEQIIGLYEIKDFRIDLMDAVSKFQITEEERLLMKRIQSIKRDNQKWAALSNALNPTMLLTGGGKGMGPQVAFQVLLTAARTAVEYKTMQGEQNIEELQAMWELRKEDMQTINELRKTAQEIVFELYNKYNLKENDRLTESTANLFNEYISEENAAKRIRILEDNANIYNQIPEFYYHLGMAYLDQNDYSNAKIHFSKYLEMYKSTPFLRYDERSGCIALAILANDKGLSIDEKKNYIDMAIKNMPNNSAAILHCAMIYIYELGLVEDGFRLIRSGVDNVHASDRNLLYLAAANLLPAIKKNKDIYDAISYTFNNSNDKGYDSFITYLIYNGSDVWKNLNKLNQFSHCYSRPWYTLCLGKKFSSKFHLTISEGVIYNENDFCIYYEKHDKNKVSIHQLKPKYRYAISEKDIDNIKCFKNNKNLKYLYVENISDGVYKLKKDIDIIKIKDETWPRQSEFVLSNDDIDDIIDFCKKFTPKSNDTELLLKKSKSAKKVIKEHKQLKIIFFGDSLVYEPHHSNKQKGYYIRIVMRNGIQIVYKYDDGEMVPYFYSDNNNKEYFWNSESKAEYYSPEDKVGPNKSYCFKIKKWFSSKKDNAIKDSKNGILVKKSEKPKSTWFRKAIDSAKKWFSFKKENSPKDTKEKTTSNNKESSWLTRIWSSITNWFSSEDKQPQK